MSKHIYTKLAVSNILKNGKIYLPYLLTVMGSMMFYFLIGSIGSNPNIYNLEEGKEAFKGAMTLCGIIQSGTFATSVFVFIFLLYANSFVLKHQKKQFGLYRVLGMERKHIVKVVFVEVLTIFSVGLAAGVLLGILLDKLMLVVLFKVIGQTAPAGFYLNITSLIQTLFLALIIAGLLLVFNVLSTLLTKDIDLLKSEKQGEKEPKNRPLYSLVGLVALAIGYHIALKTTNVGSAVNNFFPAALCVMYATYVLFMAGSITLLKALKKNKKYYYKTKHFISVSGMLYRMKQNATGLATICILSTAAIIVLSAGVSLYANGERSIREQFPRRLQFFVQGISGEELEELYQAEVAKQSFQGENAVRCTFAANMFVKTEGGLETMENAQFTNFEVIPDTYILTLEEYNRFNDTNETLKDDEILLYASDGFYTANTLTFQDNTYTVKGVANSDCLTYIKASSMSMFSKLLLVLPNDEVLHQFIGGDFSNMGTWLGFDSKQSAEELAEFGNSLCEKFKEDGIWYQVMLREQEQEYFYSMYGGILFVGAILGVLFILCTVMIIYYKQISEGYEDKERFLIMQKVGLSKEEIKRVIHSQIMLVFFLPLVTAILHAAVASGIVAKCLQMVVAVHMPTFIASVALTCVVFSVVYGIVYKITSKEYYGIVNS